MACLIAKEKKNNSIQEKRLMGILHMKLMDLNNEFYANYKDHNTTNIQQ